MSRRCCPVPNCTDEVPSGTSAVFCVEHHFQLPYQITSNIFRLKFTLSRTEDDDVRQHLREQIEAHVSIAVRGLTEVPSHVPQNHS